MNKKASLIVNILNKYFPNPQIPLDHKNTFTLLIALILSSQAQDISVNKITPILFKKADTAKKMSLLKKSELEKIIKPLGLSKTKAKTILSLCKILQEKYSSKIPDTFEELEKLPGIGHKTAGCILSYSFNKYAFPVDTHIFRCARRWKLSKGKTPREVEEDLKKIFPKRLWKKLHIQIVLFGRKYCKAKNHKKENCPICRFI